MTPSTAQSLVPCYLALELSLYRTANQQQQVVNGVSNLSVNLHCELGDALVGDLHKLGGPENILRCPFWIKAQNESHVLPHFAPEILFQRNKWEFKDFFCYLDDIGCTLIWQHAAASLSETLLMVPVEESWRWLAAFWLLVRQFWSWGCISGWHRSDSWTNSREKAVLQKGTSYRGRKRKKCKAEVPLTTQNNLQ